METHIVYTSERLSCMESKRDQRKRRQQEEKGPKVVESTTHLDDHAKRIVQVRLLMRERANARATNNFTKSDEIRDKLTALGVFVKDQKDGPSGWKFLDGSSNKLPAGTKIPEEAKKRKRTEIEETPEVVATPTSKSSQAQKKSKKNVEERPTSSEASRNLSVLQAATSQSQNSTPGQRTIDGIGITDKSVGSGTESRNGSRVRVHYVGKLKSNGKIFDASTKKPFTFRLGAGEVIRGWDIGVQGMRVGGERTLVIPPEKAYGRHGAPPTIPGNAWLVFDVKLLDVK
jgi:FK506-binding nuclear protein